MDKQTVMQLYVWVMFILTFIFWSVDYNRDLNKNPGKYPMSVYFVGWMSFWIVLGWVPYWIIL